MNIIQWEIRWSNWKPMEHWEKNMTMKGVVFNQQIIFWSRTQGLVELF